MIRRVALQLALLLCVPLAASAQVRTKPEPVQAQGFRVCNKTSAELDVAKALNVKDKPGAPDDIISEGWYKLEPGRCLTLYPGKLEYRYYLVYAEEIGGRHRTWTGDKPICVSREKFTIRGGTCGPEYNRRMFKQVDTGDEQNSWTHSFTD